MGSSFRRVSLLAAALLLALTAPLGAADVSVPVTGAWLRPVDGAVVHPFEEPPSVYAAGHRGVDLAAAPGTPVRAANDGEVTFAGSVAGTLHVTVAHPGGLRTSYSFLQSVAVRTGAAVARGDVIGTTGGANDDHDGKVLHLGLRLGDRYLDPMLLFRPTDLTEIVRLVPVGAPAEAPWTAADERRELQLALRLPTPGVVSASTAGDGDGCGDGIPLVGDLVSGACDVAGFVGDHAGDAIEVGLSVLGSFTGLPASMLDTFAPPLAATLDALRELPGAFARALAGTPIGVLALDVLTIGRRFVDTVTAACSEDAPEADGTGGSMHRVMVVAGINSAGRAGDRGPTVDLDPGSLGYRANDGEVRWFSYADGGGAYEADATHGPIPDAAERLYEQLQAMQREEPGREVDLVAHSQGGVVVDAFLQRYRASDPTLPPLGNVVTVASPHEGAPLATAGEQIRDAPLGEAALEAVRDLAPGIPPPNSAAVRSLSERSSLVGRIQRRGVPEHFDYTSIGASEDVVVPATNISLRGATEAVVAVNTAGQHSAVLNDPDALRAMRAALEGRPPPCVGLDTALRSAVAPVVIRRVSNMLGDGAATLLGGG